MPENRSVTDVFEAVNYILDNIVRPTCGIGPIVYVDPYTATLYDYAQGDTEQQDDDKVNEVLNRIGKHYNCDRESLAYLKDEPIALIALYAVVEGKNGNHN